MDREQWLRLSNAAPQGERPHFFADPDVDRLLAIVWAMAGELAVTRERLDTVERLLAQREVMQRADIDAYRPDATAARERGEWQMEYLARLLRILQQEQEQMARRTRTSSEALAGELGRAEDASGGSGAAPAGSEQPR